MGHFGNLDITAMVLGYFAIVLGGVLALFVLVWAGRELVHHHRRKQYEEDEMEHARSQWFFEDCAQDHHDTDILDFPATVEYEAVSYQKEHTTRGRRKARN